MSALYVFTGTDMHDPKLAAKAKEDYGDAYCGGQIEASLRKVLGA